MERVGRTCEKYHMKALSGCMCLEDTSKCLKLIMWFHWIVREWILKAWKNLLGPNGLHFKQAFSGPIFSFIAISTLIQHYRQIQMSFQTSHGTRLFTHKDSYFLRKSYGEKTTTLYMVLSIYLSVHPSVRPWFCQSIHPSIYPSIHLSIHPPVPSLSLTFFTHTLVFD